MVSIFAKARICRGNTQVHLQFFCKSKLQSTQKGRAATQMYRTSASSEISFHGLPSKSKPPSIRKQRCHYRPVNSISFYETAISREIFSKYFFAIIFVNFQKILAAHQNMFRKTLESLQKNTRSEFLCCMLLQEQPTDAFYKKGVLRKVFAKFTEKSLCQRLYFNKVASLML